MDVLAQIATSLSPKRSFHGPFAESIELLVLQPTPFCNIGCDYCYLPERNSTRQMTLEIIQAAVRMVLDADLVAKKLCIAWHAGEPLVLSTDYYERAFLAVGGVVKDKCSVFHSFQTNGTLLSDEWCVFLKKHSARIGLSIDGPAFIHDAHRKTRDGKSTHSRVMEAVKRLNDHGISYHVIAVLTSNSLDHAGTIFSFFAELGVRELGFNVEELEGAHPSSSLAGELQAHRIERFWAELYRLYLNSDRGMEIREFRRAQNAILLSKANRHWHELAANNDQVLPFRILTVDCNGGVSTFSPELIGTPDRRFNDFIFGNVLQHDIVGIRSSEPFQRVGREIWSGVQKCARNCEYFSVCGGGAPANKYFENHALSSAETMFCRSSIQSPLRVVLNEFERKLNVESHGVTASQLLIF